MNPDKRWYTLGLVRTKSFIKLTGSAVITKYYTLNFFYGFVNFLVTTLISATVYKMTGSHFMAGSVFACQWILPILFAPAIANFVLKSDRQYTVTLTETVGLFVYAIAFTSAIFSYLPGIYLALALRGAIDITCKGIRNQLFKTQAPVSEIRKLNVVLNTWYFIGIAGGSILSSVLLQWNNVQIGYTIAVIATIAAIALTTRLPKGKQLESDALQASSYNENVRTLMANIGLLYFALYYMISVALFQGFHNIARSLYATHAFPDHPGGLGFVETIYMCGVLSGAIVAYVSEKSNIYNRIPIKFWFVAGLLTVLLMNTNMGFLSNIAIYFMFSFCYEIIFLKTLSEIIALTPPEKVRIMMAFVGRISLLSMLLVFILTAVVGEYTGLLFVTVIVSFVGITISLILENKIKQAYRRRQTPVT